MGFGIDNRVATHEAQRAVEASGQRLERAMDRSANNARDAATLSQGEFKAEIADKGGIAKPFENLDRLVYNTAANIAKGRDSGQVGASEIRQAVGLWKAQASLRSGGDGFLAARHATAASLQNIHAAAQKHESYAALKAEQAHGSVETPAQTPSPAQQQAPVSQQRSPAQQQAPISQQRSPAQQQAPISQQRSPAQQQAPVFQQAVAQAVQHEG
jgi:hypothetical protein